MIEPIYTGPHRSLIHRPELEGRQIIFDCGNGYGLSVVTAKGSRWDHGLYCDDHTYEVLLIANVVMCETTGRPTFDFVDEVEPKGWLSIMDVGHMVENIAEFGEEGYDL